MLGLSSHFTKDDLIDGDQFERLAQELGLVYTETHKIAECLKSIGPEAVNILSHNSDGGIVSKGMARWCDFEWDDAPSNVNHWLAQNAEVRDERLIPLPIGLERDRWSPPSQKKDAILSTPIAEIKKLMYLNVTTGTNPSRQFLYRLFANKPWCTAEDRVTFPHYVRQLGAHKFVLSPDGNGMDTHRTWEALYLGASPIVERHYFTEEFAKQLPLLIVDSWSQITEDFLNRKYREFASREWNWDALSIHYWESLIREVIA